MKPRLLAWMDTHNAHGVYWDSLIFLPEGDKPQGERAHKFVRAPWLDEPPPNSAHDRDRESAKDTLDDRIAALRVAVLDFTPSDDPRDLESAMSRLSEEAWSAGWSIGCEFVFWDRIMCGSPTGADALALLELALMARHFGGWYFWDTKAPAHDYSHSRFVTLSEWVPVYEAWKARQTKEEES